MYPGSGEVQLLSTFLTPVTSLGWVPLLSFGERAQFVCLGRAPLFPVALWRPGPSLGILCGSSGSGTCCRGSGQGQEGWSHLGCLPTAASVEFFGWPLPVCSQVPLVPKGEVFNPLEFTTNSGLQGCPLRSGNCLSISQLGPCIFISSQVPPIMSWSYSLLVTVRNKATVLFSLDWPINEEVAFSNDEITRIWVLIHESSPFSWWDCTTTSIVLLFQILCCFSNPTLGNISDVKSKYY